MAVEYCDFCGQSLDGLAVRTTNNDKYHVYCWKKLIGELANYNTEKR